MMQPSIPSIVLRISQRRVYSNDASLWRKRPLSSFTLGRLNFPNRQFNAISSNFLHRTMIEQPKQHSNRSISIFSWSRVAYMNLETGSTASSGCLRCATTAIQQWAHMRESCIPSHYSQISAPKTPLVVRSVRSLSGLGSKITAGQKECGEFPRQFISGTASSIAPDKQRIRFTKFESKFVIIEPYTVCSVQSYRSFFERSKISSNETCFFSTRAGMENGEEENTRTKIKSVDSEEPSAIRNKAQASPHPTQGAGKVAMEESVYSVKRFNKAVADLFFWFLKASWNVLVKAPGVIFYYLTDPKALREKLKGWKEFAKKEANHYWMGTKLLAADVRTARRLLSRTLNGSPLTRRERKQLLRTTADLFRLVPMSMFVIIPFMEFALPFALKIFPNMLPSTFQDSLKAEENMKRELQSRIAMAGFFQETLHDLAKKKKIQAQKILHEKESKKEEKPETEVNKEVTAAQFLDFLEHARSGDFLPPDVIIRFSKYFHDELTLDNLPRTQLVNLCRYMGIPAYGSDPFLRFQLRHKIRTLKEDDQRILWEGIGSLTKMELREACQERGMRSTGLSKEQYKVALQQWLDLSVNMNVPIALLIMSRSFFLYDELKGPSSANESSSVTGLSDAISALDQDVLNQVVLEVATNEERSRNPDVVKISLEVLEQENEKIKKEFEERVAAKRKEEAKKKEFEEEQDKKVKEEKKISFIKESEKISPSESIDQASQDDFLKHKSQELESASPLVTDSSHSGPPISVSKNETLDGKISADSGKKVLETEGEAIKKGLEDNSLSAEELSALAQLTSPSSVDGERAELERIKQAISSKVEGKDKDEIIKHDSSGETKQGICEDDIEFDSSGSLIQLGEENKNEISSAKDLDDTQIVNQQEQPTSFHDESITYSVSSEIIKTDESDKLDGSQLVQKQNEPKDSLDKTVDRLKQRLEKMVGKIELQLSDVDEKIGNKMHFLDKDMDGVLTPEEVAQCLRLVLKREISFDVAMKIAEDMDTNKDGLMTIAELNRWIETNKIVKFAEEGRDEDVDRAIAKAKEKSQEQTDIKDGV